MRNAYFDSLIGRYTIDKDISCEGMQHYRFRKDGQDSFDSLTEAEAIAKFGPEIKAVLDLFSK